MTKITIEISIGEAMDRLSILLIKAERIHDDEKLKHIHEESKLLRDALSELDIDRWLAKIKKINEQMWDINERRKSMIHLNTLDEEFTELSLAESQVNDERFRTKREIDIFFGSSVQEQKSYSWA